MKVLLIPRDWFGALHLEPENARDHVVLEALVAGYELLSMGRHAQTHQITYVEVAVIRENPGVAIQGFADASE